MCGVLLLQAGIASVLLIFLFAIGVPATVYPIVEPIAGGFNPPTLQC
jgi:hypothetical protein